MEYASDFSPGLLAVGYGRCRTDRRRQSNLHKRGVEHWVFEDAMCRQALVANFAGLSAPRRFRMKKKRTWQPKDKPAIELEITLPIGLPSAAGAHNPLSLETSLATDQGLVSDANGLVHSVVDILGSAVAESTGWRPPEARQG